MTVTEASRMSLAGIDFFFFAATSTVLSLEWGLEGCDETGTSQIALQCSSFTN